MRRLKALFQQPTAVELQFFLSLTAPKNNKENKQR